jgi:hypothetical protein
VSRRQEKALSDHILIEATVTLVALNPTKGEMPAISHVDKPMHAITAPPGFEDLEDKDCAPTPDLALVRHPLKDR